MNVRWIHLRLVLLTGGIFLLGALAGHMATLRWSAVPEQAITESTSADGDEASSAEDSSRRQVIRSTRKVMEQYRTTLGLTERQMDEVKPHFVEAGMAMGRLPKDSPNRVDVIARLHEQIRPLLNEDQRKLCDDVLARARTKGSRSTDAGAAALNP